MRLIFAVAASVLFGTGAYLLLNRDLVRVVLGIVIISQASVLTLIASGLTRGDAPIYPLSDDVADPLSQAMALTAGAAAVTPSAICKWVARGHLAPAGLDERNRPLYALPDLARAEKATRTRALRLVGINTH